MIALSGNLECIYLASVLQLLCNDKKSGMLRVWNDKDEVRIFFDTGDIVYSIGSQKTTRLGYLLRNEGLIPESQLLYCRQLARERKEALGKVLVERGLISNENLEELNCWKVRQTLYTLFLWKNGRFEFLERMMNFEGHILTQIDTLEIILEASRRADEMSVLLKQYPSEQIILAKTNSPESSAIEFPDEESGQIFSLIDGSRTIRDIMRECSLDKYSVYKSIEALAASGLIKKSSENSDSGESEGLHFTTVLQVYYDAMRRVCDKIDMEGEIISDEIVVQCMNELELSQQRLLSGFSLERPVDKIMQDMEQRMSDFEDHQEGCLVLIDTLDDLLLNLMNSYKSMAGEEENRKLLQEIENMLCVLYRFRKGASCGIQILSSEGTPTLR